MSETASPVALRLEQAASLIGAYRWIEQRLFELTGSWAAEPAPAGIQVHLDVVSAEHGWHAQLWADRLPVLDWFDPASVTVPALPAVGPLFEHLATLAEPVSRLAALHRVVLPRLLATYDRHLARTVPVTDGPTIRALGLVRHDEVSSVRAGEELLATLGGRAEVEAAAAAQQTEAIVSARGVDSGLVPWPVDPPAAPS